jgi:glucose/arabinose dehydrogenase
VNIRNLIRGTFVAIYLLVPLTGLGASGQAGTSIESEQANFELVEITDDLDFAWDIAFLPNGQLVLSEYDGRLRLFDPNMESQTVIETGLDVTSRGGLRGIAPHPEFATNAWLYFCYASGTTEQNHTRVARGRLIENTVTDLETIFVADNDSQGLAHYGCRLNWLEDGTLLATLGDRRRHFDKAQDLSNHYGTIIRINDDGSIPADNPFAASPGVRGEIWAYGIRNVQGAAFHPDTGELWASDHGPYGGDEIDIIRPGQNYGWPIATYGIDYDKSVITDSAVLPNVQAPLFYWYPSIAPSSVAFYTGKEFPKWNGDLFVGSLASNSIVRLELIDDRIVGQEVLLQELNVRIRDLTMGPDGSLYVLTDTADGRLFRIEPNTVRSD